MDRGGAPWDQLVTQLRGDPKRAAILGILVLVLVIVCARLMSGKSTEPTSVEARPVAVSNRPTVVSEKSVTPTSRDPAPVVTAAPTSGDEPVVTELMSRSLSRDPFLMNWSNLTA